MPSKILNFSKDRLITGVNIIDGMLFFTDNHTEPKKINIEKFKGNDPDVPVNHTSGTTKIYDRTFEERDITVIKEHPILPLSTSLSSVGGTDNDVVDSGGDGYDWNVDDWSYDDPDVDVLDNNDDISNVMSVDTLIGLGNDTLNLTVMRGSANHGGTVQEKGIYYSFSSDYSTRETLIANVGSGSFKKQDPNVNQSTYQSISVAISADSSSSNYDADGIGNQSGGDPIYWMAYAKEEGREETYGPVRGPASLKDTSIALTGTIDDFEVTATYQTGILEGVSFEATYTDNSGLAILDKAFYVSKGYLYAPSTPPTFEEVRAQWLGIVHDNDDGTGNLPHFPSRVEPGALSILGEQLGTTPGDYFTATEIAQLEVGFTYYVYGYIETQNQTDGQSTATPASFKTTSSGSTVQYPIVKHESNTPFETYIELEANISSTGDNGIITEKGYLVSTTISDGARLKAVFPGLSANADGSSQEAGVVDTYKISSADALDSLNTGPFTVSTSGKLTLVGGTEVFYMAYAKNGSGGVSYGSSTGWDREGQVASIKTISPEAREPVIILNDVSFDIVDDGFEIDFDYDISYMPSGVTVVDSGVVFALPSGNEIAPNLRGFSNISQVDNARRSRTVAQSSFTFTASGDNSFLGSYKVEDYVYDDYSTSDEEIWHDELGHQLTNITMYNPIAFALTSYAYVIGSDGNTTKTPIKVGADANSSGFTWGFDGGPNSLNYSFAPSIQTRNNRGDLATNITNTSLTLEARLGDNSATFNTPMTSLGFYYSTTDKPDFAAESFFRDGSWHEKMDAWIAKSSTTIKTTIPITPAINTHATGQGDGGWYEIDKNITGLTAGSTVYFIAYATPRQRSTTSPYAFFNTANLNRNQYGDMAEITLKPSYTSVQSGDEPLISMNSVTVGATNSNGTAITFRGAAKARGDYYSITKKGFYYKLKSIVGASATQAQIQTAMGNATNRNQITTTNFVSSVDDFAISKIISSGEYYVSAFCETSTAGNTQTFISSNSTDFNITNAVPLQDTTPVVSSTAAGINFKRVLNGRIVSNNIEIVERGFYIIGKSGTSLSMPASGSALKAIYDSPPSGVDIHKINDADGLSVFYATFSDQKRDYTYYYAAYAKNNSGEEGISSNVVKVYDAANINRFLIASASSVKVSGDGWIEMPSGGYTAGATLFIRVKTENGYDGNWQISNLGNWSGSIVPIKANKRTNNGEVKLAISEQSPNGSLSRYGVITLTHGSDSSIRTSVRLTQEATIETFDDGPDDFFPWPPEPFPDREDDNDFIIFR